jgi:hypothetical protein
MLGQTGKEYRTRIILSPVEGRHCIVDCGADYVGSLDDICSHSMLYFRDVVQEVTVRQRQKHGCGRQPATCKTMPTSCTGTAGVQTILKKGYHTEKAANQRQWAALQA